MLDYVSLRLIWWLLLGVLLIAFAIMDGFDMGVAILLHRVARTNEERRVVINTIGPVWEGNQVWLILGGGAIFAAWPTLYAVSFSGFYFAMLAVLAALIIRPVGFKYRSKIDDTRWRSIWDVVLFVGGFVPALIFGVAIGNVLQGVPFHFDSSLRDFYTGSFFALLNPFALMCGLLSVFMLSMHGGIYLAIKTEDKIQARAVSYAVICGLVTIILFAVGGVWVMKGIEGFRIVGQVVMDGPSNPLYKEVVQEPGLWLTNFKQYPRFLFLKKFRSAWVASAVSILGIIATVGVSMFPFILPSSSNPAMSLSVWDASSSQLTLFIMLIATLIFLPIILAYTSWVFYVLRGKLTARDVVENSDRMY
jgi:cytochrome d ubiquinol oxidase subunit II